MVLLLKHPRQPSESEVKAAFETALHGAVRIVRLKKGFEVRPELARTVKFSVLVSPESFFDDPGAMAKRVANEQQAEVIRIHQAWIGVALDSRYGSTAELKQVVGKALAGLAGQDTMALLDPEEGSMAPFVGESTLAALRSANPFASVFKESAFRNLAEAKENIVSAKVADPELAAATAEARRRFPEFEQAFHSRQGQSFSVKFPLTDGKTTEHIWLTVEHLNERQVEGKLGNDPNNLPNYKFGQPMKIERAAIEDWMYQKDGKLIGAFSVKVLAKRQR